MAIYRGTGGSGDSNQDSTLNEVTQQATNAATSATEAATSASAASSSEAGVNTSATNAANSATAAANSASASETSKDTSAAQATTATTKASEASTSATNAAASASTASTQATNSANSSTTAATSETNSANSATASAYSATTATTKASEASTSATTATTKASEAATSETNADTSATSSASSASTATTKASEASTSATNAASSLASFTGKYVSQSSAPSSPATGDLWFDTSAAIMKVYNGSGWVSAGSSVSGVQNSVQHTATAGQTSFNATYDAGYLQVYLNGMRLDVADYTATSGSAVVLGTGATLNDVVFIHSFGTFELSDHYNKVDADARYAQTVNHYTKTAADANLAALVDSSPAALDTLNELAAALGDDPNFATTVNNSISLKAPLASPSFTGTVTTDGLVVDGDVELSAGSNIKTSGTLQLSGDYDGSGSGNTELLTNGGTVRLKASSGGDISFYEDTGTTAKFFWDASAENLQIGTIESSAGGSLAIKTDSSGSGIAIEENSGSERWALGVNASGDLGFLNSGESNASVTFDDSGNVLVGTTDSLVEASSTEEGVAIFPNKIGIARTDGPPANFNRMSTDGDIVKFRSSGTVVGSIGSYAGAYPYVGQTGSTLLFNGSTSEILPRGTNGAAKDGLIDLANGNNRFKDLYLSGGVNFGSAGGSGTTSTSNLLDDYEEGTWSPTINVGTVLAEDAHYTKIGNTVHLSAKIANISNYTDGSNVTVGNLPFSSTSTNRGVGTVIHRYFSRNNGTQLNAYIGHGYTHVSFFWSLDGTNGWDYLSFSHGTQSNMDIFFNITYTAA